MNSLRVDGFFVWSSYGTGMGRDDREARCCRHYLGSHALHIRVVGGRLCTRRSSAYIIPFTPSSACIFLSPRFTARHTRMNMDAVKGFLAPLGLNTSSIQDTLVCTLRSFPTLGQGLQLYFAETGCHWWHSRDCPKSLDICMEWIC